MVTVAIDAGHGGRDSGGGTRGELVEKDWVLDCAKLTVRLLTELGVNAFLVRDADEHMSLSERGRRELHMAASLVVSIHVNGCDDDQDPDDFKGALVLNWPGNKQASMIAHEIARRMPGALQRARVHPADERYPRVRNVMRPQPGDSVLVEVGYATNELDRTYLLSPWAKPQVAAAIAAGVLYWREHYGELRGVQP